MMYNRVVQLFESIANLDPNKPLNKKKKIANHENIRPNNIQNIDLLKLDIEGYELRVLHGAKEMLKKGSIMLIQFEFGVLSKEKYSLKEFFDILGEQYQICRILKHGYYPLEKYNHYYEIMTVTNFIAIKKGYPQLKG